MILIKRRENRIALFNSPYALKDVIKEINGRRWAPQIKAWTFPMALDTFSQLVRMFPDAKIEDDLEETFRAQAIVVAAGEEAKNAEDGNALPDPQYYTRSLWHHQKRAFWFAFHRLMAVKGAMLALDMGCGKTKVAIDLARNLQCRKILIMCPKNVIRVWPKMLDVDAPYAWPVYAAAKGGLTRRANNSYKFLEENGGQGIIVVNHEAWQNAYGDFIMSQVWDMVIVDECHRAKAPGGKFSRFLGTLRRKMPHTYILGLTGTPAPHSPLDLYAQARFIDTTIYGTNFQAYKNHYAIYGGYQNHQLLGFRNERELRDRFERMAIQIKKRDALDLPPVTHQYRLAELSPKEMELYRKFKQEAILQMIDGTITASNALVKLLRLAQITQGWVKDDDGEMHQVGTTKADMLRDVLQYDVPPGEPAVVFCRFHTDLDTVHEVCEHKDVKRRSFELAGTTRSTNVEGSLEEWDAECERLRGVPWIKGTGGMPVIAVQSQAGGEGVDLTNANYCIYMSVDYSLGRYDQSLARVDRPGQTSPVTYIHLLAKNTVDEKVYAALQDRRNIVEAILGSVLKDHSKEIKGLQAAAINDALEAGGLL